MTQLKKSRVCMTESGSRKWVLIILLLALALRVGFVFWLQNKLDASGEKFLIAGDAEGYWELARSIKNGDDYAVHQPPRYVHRMPGLPVLLGLSMSLFGESFLAARVMLATIGALTCGLVYLLGKRIHSPMVGLIASALLAVSPAAIGFSGLILSETAFGFALVLSLLGLDSVVARLRQLRGKNQVKDDSSDVERRKQEPLLLVSLLTGLAIALGVYMKPSWILIGLIAAVGLFVFFKPRSQSVFAGILIMAGLLFGLAPWGMRNQMVTGHFKLTTFWMGPSLYDGLNPDATGDSDMRFFDNDQLPLQLSEYEVDREYQRRAKSFARQNPGRVAELVFAKLWRYWKPWPNAAQFHKPLISIGLCLYSIPLFLLAIWGVWAVRQRIWSIVILAGPIFYFSGLHAVFVSSLRYRLPAEAPVSVLAAIGIVSLWKLSHRQSSGFEKV